METATIVLLIICCSACIVNLIVLSKILFEMDNVRKEINTEISNIREKLDDEEYIYYEETQDS